MNIIKIRSKEINHPDLFDYTVTKFLNGFKYNNINIIEINSLKNINELNKKTNIVFISAHTLMSNGLKFLQILGEQLSECVFICFHFNYHLEIVNNMPFKKYILTGENHLIKRDLNKLFLKSYNDPRWVPFKFAADVDPCRVGTYTRKNIYKSFFIGPNYENEYGKIYRDSMPDPSFYHNTFGSRIDESKRIEVILSSRTCLGFHSKGNILNGCITERVFEGMAYGCNVISDNPVCESVTEGVCSFIQSTDSMLHHINKSWSDDDYFSKKQLEGYNFTLKDGLYYHRAKEFLTKIKSLYG